MQRRTRFQGIMKNLSRRATITQDVDWNLVRRQYIVDYRTITSLDQTLRQLNARGRLIHEGSYNRGGKRGRDIRLTRTITSFRSHNDNFAFQLIRYHRSSPHFLVVIGELGKWQAFFEANIRPANLEIRNGKINKTESLVTV